MPTGQETGKQCKQHTSNGFAFERERCGQRRRRWWRNFQVKALIDGQTRSIRCIHFSAFLPSSSLVALPTSENGMPALSPVERTSNPKNLE
uniref:Uncharacterized protein n=1 Tax=Ascaris lumbricoides TaxID=6252 RepID=A0A0M3HU57_ASCLU